MRASLLICLLVIGCTEKHDGKPIDGGTSVYLDAPVDADPFPAPALGFQLKNPTLVVNTGYYIGYCWYFHTPNPAELDIRSWSFQAEDGIESIQLFLTDSNSQPDDTVSADPCGLRRNIDGNPQLVFTGRGASGMRDNPNDDGAGTPVAQHVAAHQAAVLRIVYRNTAGHEIRPHVRINATAYPAGTTVTRAATYAISNDTIHVTPMSTQTVSGSCAFASTRKVFALATDYHQFMTSATVSDGATQLAQSTDYLHPADEQLSPAISITSGQVSYSCSYLAQDGIVGACDDERNCDQCVTYLLYTPASATNNDCIDSTVH